MRVKKKGNVYHLDFRKRKWTGSGKTKAKPPLYGVLSGRRSVKPVKRRRPASLDPRGKPIQAMFIFGVIVFLVTVYLRLR